MKKFLYLSAAALTTLLAASCSSDDPAAPAPAGEGTTFTVKLPADLQTRADFGLGKQATTLKYAVYEKGTKVPLKVFEDPAATFGTATFGSDLTTKVNLNLPHGVVYDIVFFAYNPTNDVYNFQADNATFKVNYANMTKNGYSELNDCFTATRTNFSIQGPTSETITLTRPVAQLNIGTSDRALAQAGGLTVDETKVTVLQVNNEFDFLGGTAAEGAKYLPGAVTAAKEDVNFGPNAIPTGEPFPYKPEGVTPNPYEYMSMNYILVPTDKDIYTVKFGVNDGRYEEVTFENVPMQRNYRTNIFGALLTSPAEFHVVIDPSFETPDYDYNYREIAVSTQNDLINALGQDDVKIIMKNDLNWQGDRTYTVTGRNVIIEGNGHSIQQYSGYFDIKGSCENFEIRNAKIQIARANKQSAFYVKEAGTRSFIVKNCTFSNWAWDAIQILSNTVENVTITGCTFNHGSNGTWPPTMKECERAIHIQILNNEGHDLYPSSDMKVNISNNNFAMPGYIKNEFVGVYNVNTNGITFADNFVTGSNAGNVILDNDGKPTDQARPISALFNFWNYDPNVTGNWVNNNDLFRNGVKYSSSFNHSTKG